MLHLLLLRKCIFFSKKILNTSKQLQIANIIQYCFFNNNNFNFIFYKKKNNISNIIVFLRDLFTINLTQNINKFFSSNRYDLKSIFKLNNSTPIFNYNLKNVYKELYNTYIFFFNAGYVNASFIIITQDFLYHNELALNYFITQQLKNNFFYTDLTRDLKMYLSKYTRKYPKTTYFDFLFLIDGNISEKSLWRFARFPSHIFGVTTKQSYKVYFDNLFLLESLSIDVQFFFVEFALYSFLSGIRQYKLDLFNIFFKIFKFLK